MSSIKIRKTKDHLSVENYSSYDIQSCVLQSSFTKITFKNICQKILKGEGDSSSELLLPSKCRRMIRLPSFEDDNSSDKIAKFDEDRI